MTGLRYADRRQAGEVLARSLSEWRDRADVTVLGVSLDGEATARAVAQSLGAPCEIWTAGEPKSDLRGRTAVLVDDGMVTGGVLRDALAAARRAGAARVVAAAPAASWSAFRLLREEADRAVCPLVSEPFSSVDQAYQGR